MARKVASGGASARSLVLKAMEHHIGFRELYGVEQTFDELKASIPEISYIVVIDLYGVILYQRFSSSDGAVEHFRKFSVLAAMSMVDFWPLAVWVGNQYVVSMLIVTLQQSVGMLHIGVAVDFVDKIILEMLYDVVVVLVVALFLTLELLNFMVGTKLAVVLSSLGRSIEADT